MNETKMGGSPEDRRKVAQQESRRSLIPEEFRWAYAESGFPSDLPNMISCFPLLSEREFLHFLSEQNQRSQDRIKQKEIEKNPRKILEDQKLRSELATFLGNSFLEFAPLKHGLEKIIAHYAQESKDREAGGGAERIIRPRRVFSEYYAGEKERGEDTFSYPEPAAARRVENASRRIVEIAEQFMDKSNEISLSARQTEELKLLILEIFQVAKVSSAAALMPDTYDKVVEKYKEILESGRAHAVELWRILKKALSPKEIEELESEIEKFKVRLARLFPEVEDANATIVFPK